MVELVDTRDLKSLGVRAVPVQVRPGAPSKSLVTEIQNQKGALAEWLCSGLQIRGPRFDSGRRLHYSFESEWLSRINATLAQLVERNLAKVEVTSSNLVCRYRFKA